MGAGDKHKVCFEVLGVPVIIRALETYNLCGSTVNVVVVGAMSESVMATVNQRFHGTSYAFQEQPRGTGDAARKGAEILERIRFEGDVLVVAGDKVIDPRVIRQLLAAHEQSGADVTLAAAKRPANSSAGILLKSVRGNIAGILEESERRRLVALGRINDAFRQQEKLARETIDAVLAEVCDDKTARALAGEIWGGGGLESKVQSLKSKVQGLESKVQGLKSKVESNVPSPSFFRAERVTMAKVLRQEEFEERFTKEERLGCLRVGEETVPASQVLRRFDQMNLSTYLFRAPVLYDALGRLKPARRSDEEYLTDVFEILARRKKPARVVGCEIQDLRELMSFNNPQELLAVEKVYRQRHGPAVVETTSVHGT